jgi:tape measure domain-containing protein
MGKNYVEEFFIGIGFDTDRVKKEAKQIDKILDGFEKTRKKKSKKVAKGTAEDSAAVFKAHFQKEQRLNDMLLKNQFKAEAKKRKEVGKTSKSNISERQKEQRLNDMLLKNQFKASEQIRKASDKASNFTVKKEAAKRAAIDKTTKALERQVSSQVRGIQRSGSFTSLKQKGKLGDTNERMGKMVKDKDIQGLKDLKAEIGRTNTALNKYARSQRGLTSVQRGLTDSTHNMIRSYASVFALFQGTVAIKRVGQDFQGMEASMLAASGSAPAAAKDIAFVGSIVDEMGLSLKDTTDAFVKFKFAAKGKMEQTEIESLFKNVSMFGTALKVAPEDMKRAQRALSQMMSKGKIMSEELKLQLGDALPGAVQVFAKALNMSEAELFKQMEQGNLVSSEVLPKVAAEYRRAAEAGGAYALSLKGLRVTEGKFLTQTQRAGKTIFNSGFEEGLSKLYITLSQFLEDAGPQLKKLGQIFGAVFKGIAHALLVVEPLIKVFIDNMGLAFGAGMLYKVTTFTAAVRTALMTAFLPITAALAAMEELASLFNDKLVGSIERSLGMQVNLMTGKTRNFSEKDGKFTDTGEGISSKFAEGFTLRNMFPAVSGTSDLIGGAYDKMFGSTDKPQQAPITNNVTNNNTFPNVGEDTFNRITSQAYNGAMKSQSN